MSSTVASEAAAPTTAGRAPSVDIYVTYRCNLRCVHCFVGDNLNTNADFAWPSLKNLLTILPSWGTTQVTLLGGEPTTYPHLVDAVLLCGTLGLHPRLVTNGGRSFQRFLLGAPSIPPLTVGISIDGSSAETHDLIRGRGSFNVLLQSIGIAHSRGHTLFGIVSVGKYNQHDLESTLRLCESLKLEWVNIHYVSNRGFATSDQMLSIDEWRVVLARLAEESKSLSVQLRVERTFVERSSCHSYCAVRARDNLMFFPDGRVFYCSLFIDLPDGHAQIWDGVTLQARAGRHELWWAGHETELNCPAVLAFNPTLAADAVSRNLDFPCIFAKERLSNGQWQATHDAPNQ